MSGPFDSMISSLRGLNTFNDACAREAAPLVADALKRTAAAGTSPDGKPWPAKKDGGKPLVNAPSHVTAKANGPIVRVALQGSDVWHNYGTGRNPKREIIPSQEGDMPAPVADAVEKASDRVFARTMGGSR